jgi:hypothetical protein
MKKLSTYLFLFLFSFSVPSFADDIRDLEIGGMSVGDSLLNYFNKKEINDNFFIASYYEKNEKFYIYESKEETSDNFEIYDGLQLVLKRKDKKLKINSILGFIDYSNNIENCYKKQNEIVKEFSNLFNKQQKKDWGILDTPGDKNGNYKPVTFDFDTGGRVMVACYDWSPERGWFDTLKVSIYTKEYRQFINSRQY